MSKRLVVGVVAAGIALAGCASGSSASSGGAQGSGSSQHVTIEGNSSLRFMPMIVHVHHGKVRVTLKDMGAYPHDLVIPGLGVKSATVSGDPGDSATSFSVDFAKPGRYPFHCQFHQSAGMTGVFIVS